MDEQTGASCAPSCVVEMPKFPSHYSLFPWECCGEELVCGIPLARLADSTTLPLPSPPPLGVAPAQSSLPAPGRAAGDVRGAEHSRGGTVTCQQGHATCIESCQLLCCSHSSHLLPSLVTASWSCPPYLTRKPRSSFPKESSQRTSRRARSTCVTPRSRSERVCPSVLLGCRSFGIRSLPCGQPPASLTPHDRQPRTVMPMAHHNTKPILPVPFIPHIPSKLKPWVFPCLESAPQGRG